MYFKKIAVLPLRNVPKKNEYFFYNSVICWEIILIFELDQNIDETELRTKFQLDPEVCGPRGLARGDRGATWYGRVGAKKF